MPPVGLLGRYGSRGVVTMVYVPSAIPEKKMFPLLSVTAVFAVPPELFFNVKVHPVPKVLVLSKAAVQLRS
ncbi:hypothetical protein FFWV33_02950 [Flavobacterium faecale]|uniref:Uncharacterized protein n=1 Tax=Flavobacterium faecale TaxID=1355330 RepID=A0A2S1L9X5_9FLAO|nr:hypothetical protein [Flavobacterium faecale]AWG20563.1 hypothetical protein FFWV33_02950 [Flavobacterium faecale]